MKKVTAVIPAFNEAGRIGSTVQSVLAFVDEVLVIDDGSTDGTAIEAAKFGARVVHLEYNQGYIAAIKRGFQEAQGNIVVTLDGDGELPAQKIPELVTPIQNGEAEMVQGKRDMIPRLSERFINWLAHFKGQVGDSGTGMRAISTDFARTLNINGVCICGVLSLEVTARGGRILETPIHLRTIDKPRRIAWYHIRQVFYLLPWLFHTK